ncbi:Rpn family recombination-promoting nuclease/putative transposase [Hugenholtzia roseola]|uniref:Rpn family recombination-promoting nuclease/putative transposase n=1 Tax=Hugenholtzia roseola TaxID=1002 RepID=UPI00041DCFAA|nr:Rpn family recombination-promoting nuclease/putative transposase [Hugenholtzia roseola]
MENKLIRFDWAMKKILRHKANFDVLEGFLSELLRFDVRIESILESESNKGDLYDKYNRVDILVRSQKGELMLVEVQQDSEIDYFQRMLFGVSKLVTEYIKEGEAYGSIKKIFSINIVYFGLGQGEDYIYEFEGNFVGLHRKDLLLPTFSQKKAFGIEQVGDLFPKYYILKVNNFDDVARNSLDEWIFFLKNSEVKNEFRAKGLEKAKEKLRYENLSESDKQAYLRSLENQRLGISLEKSKEFEITYETLLEVARKMIGLGLDNATILESTQLSEEQIENLRQNL